MFVIGTVPPFSVKADGNVNNTLLWTFSRPICRLAPKKDLRCCDLTSSRLQLRHNRSLYFAAFAVDRMQMMTACLQWQQELSRRQLAQVLQLKTNENKISLQYSRSSEINATKCRIRFCSWTRFIEENSYSTVIRKLSQAYQRSKPIARCPHDASRCHSLINQRERWESM